MISTTGDGLTVAILCDYAIHHHWMAFANWYSFSKILPDTAVHIFCQRSLTNLSLFNWTGRCKVPLHFNTLNLPSPLLMVKPAVVCLREPTQEYLDRLVGQHELDGDWVCDCHEDKFHPFVSYESGWGKFVLDSWINKNDCPFSRSGEFGHSTMTSNEIKILHLWKQLTPLYLAVAGG